MKKIPKPTRMENPVVWFTSDTYKCKADVMRLLSIAAKKLDSATKDITAGMKAALLENVPPQVFDQWMKEAGIKRRVYYLRVYTHLLSNQDVRDQFAQGLKSIEEIVELLRKPRHHSTEAIGRAYIHRLAVWIWRTGTNLEWALGQVRDEYDRVITEKGQSDI